MNKRMLSFLLAFSFAATSCGGGDVSPSDAFLIPEPQMAAVMKDASHGDLGATKRLIAHFETSSSDGALAEEWRVKARALGDAQELYYYAARTFTGARRETDPQKKREMLVMAREAAVRSYASNPDASTQKLIDEVALATGSEL